MRLLVIAHKYPPIHNAGAEWMMHAILERFVARGHEATVVVPDSPTYRLDGVVVTGTRRLDLHGLALEHDVVMTHLDKTDVAIRTAQTSGRPLVHLVHNDRQLQFHRVKPGPEVLVVPNSEWIARELAWPGNSIICRPPVSTKRYRATPGDAITLVNLTHAKGSSVFYSLAQAFPERPFLAVCGAYGVQDRRRANKARNVELIEQTPDIVNDVYARTRIVVMPSSYESWGRVAIEAAACGIPTIAHPTPGLTEALGTAGIFVDRGDLRGWRRAITALDDPAAYKLASKASRARALELEKRTDRDLDLLEAAITEHVEEHFARQGGAYHRRDDAMGILSSIKAGMRCPICGASSCSCGPSAKDVHGGLIVTVYPQSPRGAPLAVYKTWRGDSRLNETHAIRQGLLPDPESPALPRPVARRLANESRLDAVADAYAGASDEAKAHFLAEVAIRAPRPLADHLDELLAGLSRNVAPAAPKTDEAEAAGKVRGRVGDVLAWVGSSSERALEALEAERAGKARGTLIAELEKIAAQDAA